MSNTKNIEYLTVTTEIGKRSMLGGLTLKSVIIESQDGTSKPYKTSSELHNSTQLLNHMSDLGWYLDAFDKIGEVQTTYIFKREKTC